MARPIPAFRLRINVSVQQFDEYGGWTGGALTVSEERELDVKSFAEIATVLGRFYELSESLTPTPKDSTETDSQRPG